jgi:hypothetical protein
MPSAQSALRTAPRRRSPFRRQRLRRLEAVERLRRNMDGIETIIFAADSQALARPTDGAFEPQLSPIRSGIAAYYDPSL